MVFPARLLHEWKRNRFHQTQGEQLVVDELDGGVAFSIPLRQNDAVRHKRHAKQVLHFG